MDLITICDVPLIIRDEVIEAGGEVVRAYNGLMDVQFKDHLLTINKVGTIKIESRSELKMILFFKEEHGNFYVQHID